MTEWKKPLLFKNAVFNEGVNATVRLGDKWFSSIAPEDIVEVYALGAESRRYLFDAFIVQTYLMRLCDVDEDLLEHEHDPRCREPQGLLEELRRVYGENVSPRHMVTIILFEKCDPDPGEHDDDDPTFSSPRLH